MDIDANRLDDDDALDDDDEGQRRKRPKKLLAKDFPFSGLYQSHPLNVILHIYDEEVFDVKSSKLVSLRFEYLVKLNVVCVGIEGADGYDNVLCNLFPDDTGLELPHQTAKLFAGESIAFDKRQLRPYKWAQHLGGMDILPELSPLFLGREASVMDTAKEGFVPSGLALYRHQNRMKTFVQRLRSRMKGQMALEEQIESLTKLKWPHLSFKAVPWAVHSPICTLERWLVVRPTHDLVSSDSSIPTEQDGDSFGGRYSTVREDTEGTREDGELPSFMQLPLLQEDRRSTSVKVSAKLDHCRSLSSKSLTPSSEAKSPSFKKHEDILELIMDSESEMEDTFPEPGENVDMEFCESTKRSWVDYAVREFHLVLHRADVKMRLEAKIRIGMEYPLRPPFFSLNLVSDPAEGAFLLDENNGAKWFNELRGMEAEVNLHILKFFPLDHESEVLNHQICCLAMLFDFQFDQPKGGSTTRKSTAIFDVGLSRPVTGVILSRSFRGRDRRKLISWKTLECARGYPC